MSLQVNYSEQVKPSQRSTSQLKLIQLMTTILVLGKIKKENMINHHSRVPKTHLLGLIRIGLLMKLLILLKVQGQVL